jgi:predicted nuclease of restriction endonuclease-like (RecB) superfamily
VREAISQGWSVRALDRQIGTLFYERLLLSQQKEGPCSRRREQYRQRSAAGPARVHPRSVCAGVSRTASQPALYEAEIEQGLIDRLQHFLLELGKGFAFVARQKRLQVEGEDYFVDLVFYNYLLKCFVLIDLKKGKLTHQDVGQMDMYVRIADETLASPGDNPSIGLILCSERNAAVARYSQLARNPQLFASQYSLILPTEEELRAELERDRAWLEAAHADKDV